MPTYEYECRKCGYKFEEFQKITEPPLRRCPRCKGGIRRLLGTGAGIIFKGSGFYQTDYRSPSYMEKAKKEKEQLSGGGTEKSEGKGQNEPAKGAEKSEKGENS